jgi:hypothetical protein
MNTYELEIHLKTKGLEIELTNGNKINGPSDPIYHHLECEEYALETYLGKITSFGVLIEHEDHKKFIPGNRIDYINVKFLERAQTIPDVTESIKSALKEE